MYKTIVFLALLEIAYSAVHFQPYVEKPAEFADQDGCYIPELNKVVPYEEPYRPADGKPCAIYVCHTNNETQIDTCGNAVVPDGCQRIIPTPEKRTADNCCGFIICN
ncbi:uncharacterized protein LOC133525523 [Cydia pomonella]|uniref:uncharacterized protein LOC133525523 n=1 Tax=Cydia pomonella TaxID=82600 RepID=UPI002ADDCA3D|nr:uncharacterized protein LOC133525523 [Cydia pomonella]